jgi:methylmalonyl-CoA mutase N-terminal domain/subunit
VGVNRYTESTPEPTPTPLFRVDEALHAARAGALRDLRRRRDAAAVERALSAVESAARGDANLLPPILAAAESYATLGEISDRLRTVFGTHRETFST